MRVKLALAALLLPGTAHAADWREAETAHFRIFSAGDEKGLLKFAERLEQFHTLLRMATGANEADRRIVKVRVVLVSSIGDVARLYGNPDANVAGFYGPREDGAIAVVPRNTGDGEFSGQLVLFHEYAHHYMLQYTPAAYPAWYVEGFAEITSTASFERKGAITYGKAASHRSYELDAVRYPTAKMIDGSYIKDGRDGRGWSYGDAWLVTHYLTFGDTRRGQLRTYLNLINSGVPMNLAARTFGDLNALQREVSVYLAGRSFPFRAVPLPENAGGEIKLRAVPQDEAATIEAQIEMGRRLRLPNKADEEAEPDGDTKKKSDKPKKDFETRLAEAKIKRDEWLTELDTLAARQPSSVHGWRLVADARCEAEQHQACLTAAERALTIAPEDPRAQVRKAEAMLALAKDLPEAQRKAWITEARTLAARVMNANPDDPVSRLIFYRSYAAEGRLASPVGIMALREAVRLVPQIDGPRLSLASEMIGVGDTLEAIKLLRPLAYDPHGRGAAAQARGLLAKLFDMLPTMAANPTDPGEN